GQARASREGAAPIAARARTRTRVTAEEELERPVQLATAARCDARQALAARRVVIADRQRDLVAACALADGGAAALIDDDSGGFRGDQRSTQGQAAPRLRARC